MTGASNSPNPKSGETGDFFTNIARRIYSFLSSVKLALVLLITILFFCVLGVTILRGERAWALIFHTLWFNGILVLLVLNVGFCFFGRIWGRKVTLISLGMILFHLSFVAVLGGIVYNSLFYFRGVIRLTEGETLPNGQIESYDRIEHGRWFSLYRLKGETSLVKMHTGYKVDGVDKKAAYEIAVGEGAAKKKAIIYITTHHDYRGFRYFPDSEGYSVLVILYDKKGRELYGAHVPLQSLKQKDDKYLYTIGTKEGPGRLAFPQEPAKPLFDLQVTYMPDPEKDRMGKSLFQVWQLQKKSGKLTDAPHHPGAGNKGEMEQLPAGMSEADMMKAHADGLMAGASSSFAAGEKTGMTQSHAGMQPAAPSDAHGSSRKLDKQPPEKILATGVVSIGDMFRAGTYDLMVKEVRYWVIMRVSYEPGLPIVLASFGVGLGGMVITFIGRMRKG